MTNMKIPINVLKRVRKAVTNLELHTPFVQGDHEYLTNSYFMMKAPKGDKKADDRQLPQMDIAEKQVTPVEGAPSIRVNVQYLIDTLEVLKQNNAIQVDMTMGELALHLSGNDRWGKGVDISALLMKITK